MTLYLQKNIKDINIIRNIVSILHLFKLDTEEIIGTNNMYGL